MPAASRSRPNYRRRRALALGVLVALIAGVGLLLTRGDGGPLRKRERPTPVLKFVARVLNVNQGKAAPASAQQAEGDAIVALFNDYYQTAFVDPKKWGDGTFPGIATLFAAEAQASFTRDVASLTIGEARIELKRVDPTTGTLVVTVYYDPKGAPTFAVAVATFRATGTLRRAGPSLIIGQTGTFYLEKAQDAWKIMAYDATQNQEQPTPSPTASPTS